MALEVKFYNMEVEIDENLETCHKGSLLFYRRLASGVTHSLFPMHLPAEIYVARYLEQKYFDTDKTAEAVYYLLWSK